jgi:transposase
VTKKRYSPALKSKIVLEVLKGTKTTAQLASQYQVHPTQIRAWKAEALKNLETGFADKRHNQDKQQQQLVEELYRQIGQLKVELDWLKKKTDHAGQESRHDD